MILSLLPNITFNVHTELKVKLCKIIQSINIQFLGLKVTNFEKKRKAKVSTEKKNLKKKNKKKKQKKQEQKISTVSTEKKEKQQKNIDQIKLKDKTRL